MRSRHGLLAFFVLAALSPARADSPRPLALHPDNPHYFLFRGQPAVLITSGEHYGAVLNPDFDYRPYLDELKAHGFNLTRTFSGTYFEVPGSFAIVDNTLAPAAGRALTPWARTEGPGAGDGGRRFDLAKWNPEYFARLKDFVAEAGKRGIVVELVLFCTLYDDKLWHVSPWNAANNVQGVGRVGRREVFTLKDKALTAAQEAVARKIITELAGHDNIYFEICNEPYFEGVTGEWQDHMAGVIADAMKGRAHRHLIARNIANGKAKVEKLPPHVSVLNFHYATPPETVGLNYGHNVPIADDETGFRGTADRAYRTEAWDFLIAGGAVYSNLDYSFTPKHPGGTFKVTTSPGGGGIELRRQLAHLKRFIEGFDFVRMKPDAVVLKRAVITPAPTAPGAKPEPAPTARVLAERGKQYAAYVRGGTRAVLALELPAGTYRAEWVVPRAGEVARAEEVRHAGGERVLESPDYSEDMALRVRAVRR